MARSQRPLKGQKSKAKKAASPKSKAKAKAKAPAKPEAASPPPAAFIVKPDVGEEEDEVPSRAERRRGPRAIEGVLARLAAAQTLETAYHAWDELRLERALALERFAEDGRRLGEQAGFWVGAARAAAEASMTNADLAGMKASGDDLAYSLPISRAVAEAEAKLKEAAAAMESQARKVDAEFAEAELHVRAVIKTRVQRYAASARPKVRLVKHPAGKARTILHLDRLGPDESVVLMFLLSGKLPTRYGFLFDDSTENVSRPPPWLYADAGVGKEQTRPPPKPLLDRLLAPEEFAPVKGFLPLVLHPPSGVVPILHRLLQRGPVMEVEVADGDEYRNLLAPEEAERVAGALLRLQVEGRLDLELGAA
ncbi:MAG TPA: hypothetical protein VND93_26650 [Myxococcales bacterium]|jgi:hypothetical protein|nr:hypothetical protein [Myxococcales bacterium]